MQHAEAHIPAEKIKKSQKTRIQGTDGNIRRTKSFKKTPLKRQSQSRPLMLSREKRLNLKKDFKWAVAGSKVGNDLIQLYFRQGENLQPRVGIALSKSNFKKATQRNRARRLVSTGFEALYELLPGNTNIVAMPRSGVLELTSVEVAQALKELLGKGNLLNEKISHIGN